MGGEILSNYEQELRVRAGQGFCFGETFTGGNVNPSNIVIFNPAGSGKFIAVTSVRIGSSATALVTIDTLNADPALAQRNTGITSRNVGGFSTVAKFERADAATPPILQTVDVMPTTQFPPLDYAANNRLWMLGPGTGLLFTTPANALVWTDSIAWYDLPS